ncbi:ribonuclease BN (tRNA processing enzyme) [Aeribacillus sp. SP014]
MMKVTVVGFWGGYPEANEATSGYLFQEKGFNLLVDCGSAVLSQLQNFVSLSDLDAVILSHYHHDHIADIGPLQYARQITGMLQKSNKILPIYGHSLDTKEFDRLTHLNVTKGISYDPDQSISIGPFTITFLKTDHPVDCFAMRFTSGHKTVVYTADSSFKNEFIPFSQNADLLICECNMYANEDGKKFGHMNSHEAATIAKEANVKELLLTHLPHKGNHEELIEEAKTIFNGSIKLAKTGLSLHID